MKSLYIIEGMTCNGCRVSVEKALAQVGQVNDVQVSLEDKTAKLTSEEPLETTRLRAALPAKYTIEEKTTHNVFHSQGSEQPASKMRQLFPLYLIFFYLITASILLHIGSWNWQEAMLDFMGLFYIVFSFFKFLDLRGFKNSFAMYDPLARVMPSYGWMYPFIEATLGILFLMRAGNTVALITTLIILGITTIGVTRALLRKDTIQCACLGTALKLPMTEATFIENAVMIVMAITMLGMIY